MKEVADCVQNTILLARAIIWYRTCDMWCSCARNGTNVYVKRTRKKGNLKLWWILHRAGGWPIQNKIVSFCRSTVDMTVAEPGLSPDPRHPCLCTGPGQPATKRRPATWPLYPLYLPTCSTAAPPPPAPGRKSVLKYFIGTWLYFPSERSFTSADLKHFHSSWTSQKQHWSQLTHHILFLVWTSLSQ